MEKNYTKPPIYIVRVFKFLLAWTKHKLSGSKNVPENVYRERLKSCFGCPFLVSEYGTPTCGKCGCPVLKKTEWADQECPLPEPRWKKFINNTEDTKI